MSGQPRDADDAQDHDRGAVDAHPQVLPAQPRSRRLMVWANGLPHLMALEKLRDPTFGIDASPDPAHSDCRCAPDVHCGIRLLHPAPATGSTSVMTPNQPASVGTTHLG
jgi:hypothetical protein